MVVVFIIAIVTAILLPRMSSNTERLLVQEVERFKAVIKEVRNRAIISGRPAALTVNEQTGEYEFLAYEDGWQSHDQGADKFYKVRKLDSQNVVTNIEFDIFEDQAQDLVDEELLENETKPLVIITPLGSITPFELIIESQYMEVTVFQDEYSKLNYAIVNNE